MSLVPSNTPTVRLFFNDAKGSGLIMYADKVGALPITSRKTSVPGRLTDADRLGDKGADLVVVPGAQIISLDSGILYEATGTSWSAALGGVQNVASNLTILGTPGGTNVLTAVFPWAYTGTPAYQWTRDGVAISGATSATYTQVPSTDAGHRINCIASGVTPKFSASDVFVPGAAALSLSGTATTTAIAGTAMTGFNVIATGGLTPYNYSVLNNPGGMAVNGSGVVSWASPVAGTFSPQIRVTDAAATVANLNFSLVVSSVSVPVPVNSVAPTVSGTAQVGATLSGTHGTWSNTPTTYAYQWKRGATVVATTQTYVPVTADIGNTLTFSELASNSGGAASGYATSAATASVVAAASGGGVDTTPKFGYAPSNASGTASAFATLFPTMTNLTNASPGGRSGTFNAAAQTDTTLFVWVAVLASAANTGGGLHLGLPAGTGGFSGAKDALISQRTDNDPQDQFWTWTDSANNVWNFYRSNGKPTQAVNGYVIS